MMTFLEAVTSEVFASTCRELARLLNTRTDLYMMHDANRNPNPAPISAPPVSQVKPERRSRMTDENKCDGQTAERPDHVTITSGLVEGVELLRFDALKNVASITFDAENIAGGFSTLFNELNARLRAAAGDGAPQIIAYGMTGEFCQFVVAEPADVVPAVRVA